MISASSTRNYGFPSLLIGGDQLRFYAPLSPQTREGSRGYLTETIHLLPSPILDDERREVNIFPTEHGQATGGQEK
jgi:hypothetical protein